MALSGNSSNMSGGAGTADPADIEYLNHEPEGAPLGIHMHLDAVDGIARDVIEGLKALPRRGVEVGGLLLGRVIGADVWIERYQRIECEHRFGPQFALDTQDHRELERAAQHIAETTELSVVGLYRSHTRPGLQLDESDLELTGRYFSDPSDLVLLIRPDSAREISARFFARQQDGVMEPVGGAFAFRGRLFGPVDSVLLPPEGIAFDPAAEVAERARLAAEEEADPAEATRATSAAKIEPAPPSAAENAPDRPLLNPPVERMRRLVPDFAPAAPANDPNREPVEPGGVFSFDARPRDSGPRFAIEPEPSLLRSFAAKWWPLAGAIALVGAAMWILVAQSRHPSSSVSAPAASGPAAEYRPVGMYVDPGPQRWRISWNPLATAFSGARSVALFVHDGDAEDHVDLTRQDVQQGTYSWQPKGNDVTFRLEAIDAAGRISAESFRVIRSAPAPAEAAQPASALPAAAPSAPAARPAAPRVIPAKATHRVPPVVPSSIRPRIRGVIPIDVRVHIDARGRVVSATPTSRPAAGLNSYLASRAIYAARLWRFAPARENGRAVPSTQTIHFVFEK